MREGRRLRQRVLGWDGESEGVSLKTRQNTATAVVAAAALVAAAAP